MPANNSGPPKLQQGDPVSKSTQEYLQWLLAKEDHGFPVTNADLASGPEMLEGSDLAGARPQGSSRPPVKAPSPNHAPGRITSRNDPYAGRKELQNMPKASAALKLPPPASSEDAVTRAMAELGESPDEPAMPGESPMPEVGPDESPAPVAQPEKGPPPKPGVYGAEGDDWTYRIEEDGSLLASKAGGAEIEVDPNSRAGRAILGQVRSGQLKPQSRDEQREGHLDSALADLSDPEPARSGVRFDPLGGRRF
jgi:hypothetical protein